MPSLPSHNHYTCLSIDEMSEPSADELDCVKVVQEPQPPKSGKLIRLAGWEHQLPCRYIVASTPGTNSLDIDVEIKTMDTGIKCCTRSLVDCGAMGLFMDTKWAHANNITTCTLTWPIPVYNVNGTPSGSYHYYHNNMVIST